MRILVIEDDLETANYMIKGLQQHGHQIDHADNGRDGLFLASSEPYDVMVVDRMLPHFSGLTIIEALRKEGNHTPCLILSALGEVADRVEGLRAGSDDYLVKPYAFEELLVRLEVLAARGKSGGDEEAGSGEKAKYELADLIVDRLARRVTRQGKEITLKPKEFKLLEFLFRHQGQVVTRTMLLEQVWEYHFDPQTNVVDVHISRLRRKIDKGFEQQLIHTVHGAGYRLALDAEGDS